MALSEIFLIHRNCFFGEVTGNPNVGFDDEDLEGDFDPAKYDEAMQVLHHLPLLPEVYCPEFGFNILLLEPTLRGVAFYGMFTSKSLFPYILSY